MVHRCLEAVALAVAFASAVQAVQTSPRRALQHFNKLDRYNDGWSWIYLDEQEVASRGSVCMDGSNPGYFYRNGTSDDKWIIAIEGGDMFCSSDKACQNLLAHDFVGHDSMVYLKMFESDEFKDFHQVELHRCDGGLLMGDQSEPISIGGQTIYSRGKRIVDHVFDTLNSQTTFSTATEVLITGGSGGGQATALLADYMVSLMPATVKKVGAVPMSGWYTAAGEGMDIETAFDMHAMSGALAPACKAAYSQSEQYKCLQPAISYQYSETPMFVIQMLDSQSLTGKYSDNSTLATEAWSACMDKSKSGACDSAKAQVLQDYLDDFVGEIQNIPKSQQPGNGGFLSTCTKHVFFKEDEYSNYASDGTTIEDAVSTWWKNLGSAKAQWFLPCQLNTQGGNIQCESSCAFDSGSTD